MNIMKKARPLLSDQLKQAIQEARSQSNSTQTDSTQASTRHRRRTKDQEAKELQQKVDEGWKEMLKRWNRVVFALTIDDFNTQWAVFKERYADPIFSPLLDYIQAEWIDDYPEKFLHFHTKQYLHLNEIATSRTEGGHWLLKQDLLVSTNDLLVVLQTFERVVELQFSRITNKIEDEKIKMLTHLFLHRQLILSFLFKILSKFDDGDVHGERET
ncbi:hypothetical protein N7471_001873 [Penicillium samsonianum]|uniref:uncharacterized protein n=1 Tax=Penicillium samsonianum TaxID=1882272 RepID=UPI0025493ECE|nr:uncharacterized protein N7471_001873 [Penicillium samsonianum]KAJ6142420.1 hypothetical protein N7471_001873 [Penicillium samsonianum]